MDLKKNSPSHSAPQGASFHRSVMVVLQVLRLLKSMRRLSIHPAVVGVEPKPDDILTGPRQWNLYILHRKEEENFNPCDECNELRHLKLKFSNNMIKGPVYTGVPIGEDLGNTLNLDLVDCHTENIVKFGPEASGKVEIVVFEKEQLKTVTNWLDGKSLIRGDPHVKLKDGRVSVSHISFKHTNVSMRKREFRLGARAVDHCDIRTRIIEAVTEPFFVVDRRSMPKSKKPLKLDDHVWKLPTINKGGPSHHCLTKENIKTVRDFLTLYFLNRENLLTIIGRSSLQVKKLDEAVNEAKSKLELKRNVYPQENPVVKYTEVGELIGLLNQGGHFVSVQQLTPNEKTFGMEMVKRGFQDDHQNSKVLLDDDTSNLLVKRAFQDDDNKAADLDEFNNGFTFEDYNYPSDTQPVLNNVTNYTGNNYDNICQINSLSSPLQHQFDTDNNDFIYQSIWEL
ncbi:hypothetical protein KY290_018686 [Solanum tuberosum]|uniref:Calmodulin-binding protein n=1 Tax=Solanum tuberosum TaxID=4113 RepID=A0ABQ7VFQ2_SOLTU|nr:hypothetical protein KY290_018686 [Solanum tuberosum]